MLLVDAQNMRLDLYLMVGTPTAPAILGGSCNNLVWMIRYDYSGPIKCFSCYFKTLWSRPVVILSSQISGFKDQVTFIENVCKWLIRA